MAEGSTRAQYSAEDVIDLVTEDCDYEDDVDEVFFPGSDDEFGFEEEVVYSDCDDDFGLDLYEEDGGSDNEDMLVPDLKQRDIPHLRLSSANIIWESELSAVEIEPFSKPAGPRVPVPCSILEVFRLLFTSSLMEYIVDQTNLYALQCMGEEKYAVWTKVTVEEFCAFLGFMILMGLTHLPSLPDYWSKDPAFRYGMIADRISRDRFLEIMRYLHFNDNSTQLPPDHPNYNKLGKVKHVIDCLNTQFEAVYGMHRDVSVDEAMIPFKGRSSLKQYMPKKPVKRGIKVWMLADATNGYVSSFEVYTGKKKDSVEKGLGARVVKNLTQHLPAETTMSTVTISFPV